jgi:RNA polymerase sigma-70 factor (ECF subfamily)
MIDAQRTARPPCEFDDLVTVAYARLRRLSSRMLADFPEVGRWMETDDVWHNAALRLSRALQGTQPESATHFYRLAALQIRRTLIDLARQLGGPHGLAFNQRTPLNQQLLQCDETNDPVSLADWAEFHEQIEGLRESDRQMFDLLWYHGLSQAQAAKLMGVDIRTVKRRWRAARLMLQRRRGGAPPG